MNQNTIEHDMPRTVTPATAPPVTSETVSKLKLYADDHELAVKIQTLVQPIFRQITLQEILREAVRAGLPAVAGRYEAAVLAARKADKS